MSAVTSPQIALELDAKDLPAHCPNLLMPIWSLHPRVFLDLTKTGHTKCPYCGTEYCMKPGAVIKAY